MSNDSLSDLLSQLKNASRAGKDFVEVPYSRLREEVARVLEKEGYLTNVKTFKVSGKKYQRLHLELTRDEEGNFCLSETLRYSKPGLRVYRQAKELSRLGRGLGTVLISTSRGVMDLREARKRKLGGEVLGRVF